MTANKTIEEKLNEGRQYRSFDLGTFERSQDDGKMIVRGYATTFNDEYLLYNSGDYEIWEKVDPAAFDECDLSDVILQYDHAGRVFARISNGTLKVGTDERGLAIEAELSGTEIGRELYQEIEGGYTTKMSMGFRVAEDSREVLEDYDSGKITVIRTLKKVSKLYDVSAVSLPANDATSISARSFCEGVIAELLEEVEARKARDRQRKKIKLLLSLEG